MNYIGATDRLVHFVVSDVDALHDTFKKRELPITEAPNDDLRSRNMTITDPDGNFLRFMKPSTKA